MATGVAAPAGDPQAAPIPVWGCVLIGGRSTRMGRPKHLLRRDGVTWLELIVRRLQDRVARVVLAGEGEVPPALAHLPVIPDVPGLAGPLAGVLAVFRYQPRVSWLVAACDLPYLDAAALDWLLRSRTAQTRAILPDLRGDGRVEPLLAFYDRRCLDLLEELAGGGLLKLSSLVGRPGVLTPRPPAALHDSWRNLNCPGDIADDD